MKQNRKQARSPAVARDSGRYYRVGPKNNLTCFCQNFVKSLPNLIIFGTQIAKTIVHLT